MAITFLYHFFVKQHYSESGNAATHGADSLKIIHIYNKSSH